MRQDLEVKRVSDGPFLTAGKKTREKPTYRAERRNELRKNGGLGRQKRSRDYPNYTPVEYDGGGMNRHYERIAEKQAEEDLLARVREEALGKEESTLVPRTDLEKKWKPILEAESIPPADEDRKTTAINL